MGWKQMSQFALKLHLNKIQGPKKLIGLDVGSLHTGVAVSSESLSKAYFLKVIHQRLESPKLIQKLRKTIRSEGDVKAVIIGKPYSSETVNKIQAAIEELTERLKGRSEEEMVFCLVDESWTTMEAQAKVREMKRAYQYHGHLHNEKELEDGIAAMQILGRYLDYYNGK